MDDEDTTEVTSTPVQPPFSESVKDHTPEKADSPVKDLSPVREPSPILPPVSTSPPQASGTDRRRVCHLTYYPRMSRATHPSVEDRLSTIESTQKSMQQTLVELSSSVAQLVKFLHSTPLNSNDVKKGEKVLKDKCKADEQQRKPDDEDDDEKKKKAEKTENTNSEMVLYTQTEGNRSDKAESRSH